jgi:hypothetical protein
MGEEGDGSLPTSETIHPAPTLGLMTTRSLEPGDDTSPTSMMMTMMPRKNLASDPVWMKANEGEFESVPGITLYSDFNFLCKFSNPTALESSM